MEKLGLEEESMKIGIMGTGTIAGKMARTLAKMDDAAFYAAGSRTLEKAEKLVAEYNGGKAYGSYEELVQDPEVELIYIATPHSHHYENAKLCIEHGKAVLCEKAFMANAMQARKIVALAQEKNVFLAEAIWTRYMPSRKMIDDIVSGGEIGEVISLTANLGYDEVRVPRIKDPDLAGGALLDLGIYPLTFASMIMGDEVVKVTSSCTKMESGVDALNAMILEYPGGKLAILHSGILGATEQYGIVYGTEGYLIARNINNVDEIEVYTPDRMLKRVIKVPEQISGYEYEVQACIKAIQEGKTSCEEAPLAQSIHMMELMDTMRRQWGIRYPFE